MNVKKKYNFHYQYYYLAVTLNYRQKKGMLQKREQNSACENNTFTVITDNDG